MAGKHVRTRDVRKTRRRIRPVLLRGLAVAVAVVASLPIGKQVERLGLSPADPSGPTKPSRGPVIGGAPPGQPAPRPEGGAKQITRLYEVTAPENAGGPSGKRQNAILNGRTSRDSTVFWVGCGTSPAITNFSLNGGFRRLLATLTLDPRAPAALKVQVVITADGAAVHRADLTRASTSALRLSVTSVRTLGIQARALAGACDPSAAGYGTAFDASLEAA